MKSSILSVKHVKSRCDNTDLRNGQLIRVLITANSYPFNPELNSTDGCEFLDDNTRMKDQPLKNIDKEDPSDNNITTFLF